MKITLDKKDVLEWKKKKKKQLSELIESVGKEEIEDMFNKGTGIKISIKATPLTIESITQ